MTAHPAKFSNPILEVIANRIPRDALVLDPFAGTGKIHEIRRSTIGVEIEPEWAEMAPGTIVGNSLCLPFRDGSFDAIATSPVYGNRSSDHHNAKDSSKRYTYTHMLGRELHPDNSGKMQWGPEYRAFHIRAWRECQRVLKPRGIFVLNVSNHYRKRRLQRVSEWHTTQLVRMGFNLVSVEPVKTKRMRHGANRDLRAKHEFVLAFRMSS